MASRLPRSENFFKLFYGKTVPEDASEPSYVNMPRYINPAYDEFYEKATASLDEQERDLYFHKCDSLLIADAAFMPLYYDFYIRLLGLKVRAFPQNEMEYRDYSRVFISQDEE